MKTFETWITNTPISCRGITTNAPENSIASITAAVEKGFGLCLDVRALADDTIVVFKDESLGRMTGKDGFISNCKYEDIKDLTLNKSTEHIPTLTEVLKIINGTVPVIFEIKNMDKVNCEKHIYKILKDYKGEFAVASLNPYSLEWFKLNAPNFKRGQISYNYKNSGFSFFERLAYKKMKYNKDISEPNFIMYRCEDLPNRYVKKYKHLPLLAFHVKSNEEYLKLKKYVNNVIFEGFELNK